MVKPLQVAALGSQIRKSLFVVHVDFSGGMQTFIKLIYVSLFISKMFFPPIAQGSNLDTFRDRQVKACSVANQGSCAPSK